jgi:PAS domain S-box-containing protein
MQKCFLTAVILFSFISCELPASQPLTEQRVLDSLMRVLPHKSQQQKALLYLAASDILASDLPLKSFSYTLSAYKIALLEKNDTIKARARLKMGEYFKGMRNYMMALEHFIAAGRIYHLIGDTLHEVDALISVGVINRNLGNYDQALSYYQQGLDLIQLTNYPHMHGTVLIHLAVTYQCMRDSETSQYFLNQALTLFRNLNDQENEIHVQNLIGVIYLDEERYDEALTYYKKLLPLIDTAYGSEYASILTRIGHIYDKKGNYRASLHYNLQALRIRQHERISVEINSSLINIAGDYFNLDLLDSAMIYMDSGMAMAKKHNSKNLIENGYKHLYNYYLKKGNFNKALDYFYRYNTWKEKVNREKFKTNITVLEARQHLQQVEQSVRMKSNELNIQGLKLKLQTYQSYLLKILIGLAALSMIGMTIWLLYIRKIRQKMQEINVQLLEEIKEREMAEKQLREQETRYRFITENSVDFITHMDQTKKRVYASPAALNVYGYTPAEILEKSPYELTHPDYHDYAERMLTEMLSTRSPKQYSYKAIKKDGTVFWAESVGNPLFDPITGTFKGMVGVTRDIQERKTIELEIMEGTKQKEILLKEIHHRVKNNFAILVSLINMQMTQTKNQELLQSLTNLQLRIRTMALVHEMLYRSGDFEKISFPGYVRSLASVIAGTYNRRNVELTLTVEEVVMDIESLIPLGLIINELLSNAFKHAFPGERGGNIGLLYSVDHENGWNTLSIKDDGIGLPESTAIAQYQSMGLQVVQILCTQIEGTLVICNDPGATFTVTFKSFKK